MKGRAMSTLSAISLLIIVALTSTVHGRLRAPGHQHRDVLDRIMRKPVARSGSGFLGTATHNPIVLLPTVTQTLIDPGCFDVDCDPLNITRLSKVSARVTRLPHIQVGNLELRGTDAAPLSSHRRLRSRKFSHEKDGLELLSRASITTKSAVLPPSTVSNLPALLEIDLENVHENISVENAKFHIHSKLIAPRQDGGYQSFVLGGFSSPASSFADSIATAPMTAYGLTFTSTPSVTAPIATSASIMSNSALASSTSAPSVCPASNGTTYTSSSGIDYQIICNTDYLNNNLPFQLVGSFAGCVQKCDAWNYNNHNVQCKAALYLPNRESDVDDCYLKTHLVNPSTAAELIEGAIRIGYPARRSSVAMTGSTSSADSSATTESTSASAAVSSTSSPSSSSSLTAPITSATSVSGPGVTYGSGNAVIVPNVASSHLQGPSQNTPSQQYLDIKAPAGITLPSSLLTIGVNGDLTTGYELSGQTGVLEVNISTQSDLSPLEYTPHLSRDGGKGGMVNGEHLFVFCDTGSYSTATPTSTGKFVGFVSSSVAIDVGMKGLNGGAVNLQDGIGEWSDNAGRMRGFAPLTEGEVAYNQVMQGQGQRYAVWPESDIIPLDATTGVIYAPIVYDNVNELTKAAVFTYTGTTLLTITAGGKGGPVAERIVAKIFQQNEIEWGCSGGIRSWGPSGIGGDDGSVYLFGNIAGGILLGRTSPAKIADVTSIDYWNGNSWTNNMPTSSSTAFFIEGAFMDISVFYSPRHLTFIIVYLTIYADSTFYYRYLEADQGILPPFAPGGDSSSDYVENIVKYKWSEQQVLYKASPGLSGKYIYSGGAHLGYFGSNDISNGGSRMLLSWTAPTGLDPSTLTSEYQLVTAEVDWA